LSARRIGVSTTKIQKIAFRVKDMPILHSRDTFFKNINAIS